MKKPARSRAYTFVVKVATTAATTGRLEALQNFLRYFASHHKIDMDNPKLAPIEAVLIGAEKLGVGDELALYVSHFAGNQRLRQLCGDDLGKLEAIEALNTEKNHHDEN